MKNDFYTDLERGKQGEQLTKNALEKCGYTVIDVTDDKYYQSRDIDLLVTEDLTSEEPCHMVEVKSDWNMANTGNVVLEVTNLLNDRLGWFSYSEATHFIFVDMQNKIGYLCRANELRNYVSANKANIKVRDLNNYRCYLIPVEESQLFQKMAV